MEAGKSLNGRDLAIVAALMLAGALYYGAYYEYGLKLLDEGFLLDPVMRVMYGEVPYRDFHHFYAPGRFYLFAGLFKLTGPDILVTRVFWAFLKVATVALVYMASRRFAGPPVSLCAAAVALLCPGVWHKTFFTFFSAFGALAVVVHAGERTLRTAAYCGALAGAAFMFRQDIGVYVALAFLAVEAWGAVVEKDNTGIAGRAVAAVLAGTAAVLPMLAYFGYEGALGAMAHQVLFAGSAGTSANSLPFPPLAEFWSGGSLATLRSRLFYLPFAVYAAAAALVAARARKGEGGRANAAVFGLVVLGLLVLLQLKNRSDSAHLWQVMTPVLVVAAALASGLRARLRGSAPILLAVLLFGWMAAAGAGDRASGSIAEMEGNDTRLDIPRARVYVPKPFAAMLTPTLKDIAAFTPGEPYGMLAAPDIPIMYFLADKMNPTSHELYRAGISSDPATQMELIRETESAGVRLVVYNLRENSDGRPERLMKAHSPEFYGYLMYTYKPVAKHGIFELRLKGGG